MKLKGTAEPGAERRPELSHIALLVKSADKAAAKLSGLGLVINPAAVFEKGRVREIYVGSYETNSALLLLVEPIQKDAYARTFKKHGYGLHHIAVDMPDLEGYIDSLYDSGWLLHPWSVDAIKTLNTAYLCRPGTEFIIEAQRNAHGNRPRLVEKVTLPLSKRSAAMVAAAGLADVLTAAGERKLYFSNKKSILISELLA